MVSEAGGSSRADGDMEKGLVAEIRLLKDQKVVACPVSLTPAPRCLQRLNVRPPRRYLYAFQDGKIDWSFRAIILSLQRPVTAYGNGSGMAVCRLARVAAGISPVPGGSEGWDEREGEEGVSCRGLLAAPIPSGARWAAGEAPDGLAPSGTP